MKSNDKFSSIILGTNKNVIRVLIGIMTLSLILGAANLIYLEFAKIIAHPYFLVDVTTLFEVFKATARVPDGRARKIPCSTPRSSAGNPRSDQSPHSPR